MSRSPLSCLTAIIGLALAGCSAEKSEPLRIGTNAWPGYEFLHLAQAKGYYEEAGVSVRLLEFSSLADCRRAYERGQIDGMATTVIEVLQARDQSTRSPRIVQVFDYSDGGDVILARSGIAGASALKDKRIGVELASLGVYVLARGLEEGGLDIQAVRAISMDQHSMEQALKEGEIDAAVTYPPFSIRLLREEGIKTLFSTKTVPGEVVDVLAFEEDICRQRSGDVAAVIGCFHRAVTYARENPDDAYSIMAARQGITPQEFAAALSDGIRMVSEVEQGAYFSKDGKLREVVDRSDKVLRQTGQLSGPDRRADVIDSSFIAAPSLNP